MKSLFVNAKCKRLFQNLILISSNESVTVAALAINDGKKRICRTKMHNYRNLRTVKSELNKF